MFLYIDLKKAQFAGSTTPSERRSVRAYKESYTKQPRGVLGGSAAYDREEVGKDWHHGDPEIWDDEVEEFRKEDAQVYRDRGVTPKQSKTDDAGAEEEEDEATLSKAFLVDPPDYRPADGLHVIKSLSDRLAKQVIQSRPRNSEALYLTEVLGYTASDVRKGLATIQGKERGKFHAWLCDRLQDSVDTLGK